MRLTKLSLSGFKSFIEPTEFYVQAGLTGIVGPNGCGKSNLVEALRWVMGETSAKQMRGDGMDDVIFNGTNTRPARNIANVTLSLDNSDRTAPSRFNGDDEIEITRHIERGEGSTYTVNSQEVRARDVQLLFADFATGAHSSALVGQGQVNNLINAKPAKRRKLLEEASGITGLHARRHEAELRLRGAETNLERLQDVIGTLEVQLNALKRQTRQAIRYRKIADNLKKWEATLLYLRWSRAKGLENKAEKRLSGLSQEVNECTGHASQATNLRENCSDRVPPLRVLESECATALQRLTIENERLDDEEHQVKLAQDSINEIIIQINNDLEREELLAKDAKNTLEKLKAENIRLIKIAEADEEASQIATSTKDSARDRVNKLETEISTLVESVVTSEARLRSLNIKKDDLNYREVKLSDEYQRLIHETQVAENDEEKKIELYKAEENIQHAYDKYIDKTTHTENATSLLKDTQILEKEAQELVQRLETTTGRLSAEAQAIENILGKESNNSMPAIVDKVSVKSGYENALGVGLGDDLEAPADDNAPIHWSLSRQQSRLPDLPYGVDPLSKFVNAPPELSIRLSQIGVVEDTEGSDLRSSLHQGQRLVSCDGSLWRWDGYTIRAGASTPAASRLKQINRLAELAKEIEISDLAYKESKSKLDIAEQNTREAMSKMEVNREKATRALHDLNEARDIKSILSEEAAARKSRKQSLLENLERVKNDLAEISSENKKINTEINSLSESDEGRKLLELKRKELDSCRLNLEKETSIYEDIIREISSRSERLEKISSEIKLQEQKSKLATQRLFDLGQRKINAEHEKEGLNIQPEAIDSKRKSLLSQIADSEVARNQAADNLAQAEAELALAETRLKEIEKKLGAARELYIREEGNLDQCKQATSMNEDQILERLGCPPYEAAKIAEIENQDNLPEITEIEGKIQRLTKERENIGPVNLRAETEAEEIDSQITTMLTEREDLEAAIARLRQGILNLNREGRERITNAFDKIDRHFQALFTKLFGGGHAHLEMVGSDDPLEAGLEIMASPPGKRMQTLSLLSGGEKALTATALIFAAFLTNPAPICVLDEVDAPLDDTNVGRFCSLVAELANNTNTRFIIITHHRMTMTKVDRLYGVTMAEKGVSQLVSVDLTDAERWRKTG